VGLQQYLASIVLCHSERLVELFGNSIARPVDFDKSLEDLNGKEVRLKLEFSSCDLYSFIFE